MKWMSRVCVYAQVNVGMRRESNAEAWTVNVITAKDLENYQFAAMKQSLGKNHQ